MSGTFNDIDVPPTLVSFAVSVGNINHIVTPELKKNNSTLVLLYIKKDAYDIPDYKDVLEQYSLLYQAISDKQVLSAYTIGYGGIVEAVSKMAFGNRIGVKIDSQMPLNELTAKDYGCIIVETEHPEELHFRHSVIGTTTEKASFEYNGVEIGMDEALKAWTETLENVFPTSTKKAETPVETKLFDTNDIYICKHKVARPKVFIPVFPGTNCEYDSARAFQRAGADAEVIVFNNMNASNIRQSVEKFAQAIRTSQMIMIPGGFSAGD